MITFKNIAGNKFLAVGTIQRKSALNGEKSLTGTLYDGKGVLNKIDKGWSLEFNGEPYVVTYFERNDNDNSVSFDAIHKFFWDMAKKVLYSSTKISGSHTITWYLDQIFANTGYTYALNFSPAAIEKDNWGNKTRLSLFNDLITSIAGEFEINGTLISIFQNIGTDLSTIVRYGFNLSDMTLENDATNFVTYGEGFGAYADQENQTGDRVHVTYTSPLAGVYGILQAEPIDDQRYTSQTNLQAAVKAQVDASFSVSVQLSLYDLTAAGYPYKMANVGDWLTAVDENLDFKQRIRIISIDDEFSADGTRISYTVTAGDVGLTKKYQDANASMASQVANAIVSAGQASTDANFALIAANGKLTAYYVGSYGELPTTANEGDLGWVTSGDGRLLYIYTKKADGSYYWEKRIDPEMGDQIAAGVDDAVAQAKAYSNQLVATNREQVNAVLDDVQAKQADLTAQQAELDTKAKGYADKALADAKADTQATAVQIAKTASDALAKAKTDLTTSLNKEVTDRANAVTALDTKAKGYADTAKADAIAAATTADGVVNKRIDDTASSIKSIISQNKIDTDGNIATVQSTATQALNGLTTKVDTTVYNQKTNQLQTDLNTTTTTANQATTDIASIKSDNTKRDSRILTIEQTAEGQKTTISNLTTELGKTNGSIATLKSRADGFEATVTKVNNLSVGGRNLLLKSKDFAKTPDWTSGTEWYIRGTLSTDTYQGLSVIQHDVAWNGPRYRTTDLFNRGVVNTNDAYVLSAWIRNTGTAPLHVSYYSETSTGSNTQVAILPANSDWVRVKSPAFKFNNADESTIRFEPTEDVTGGYIQQAGLKLETGNMPTDWSPAPEDLSGATAKAQLTADQATTAINTYKTSNDGRVESAESKISQNATAITQKVSQTDYDKKTGQLQTDLNTTTNTANTAKQDIATIKTDNTTRDSKINTLESDSTETKRTISQLSGDLSTVSGNVSKLTQRADGFDATVTKVNNLSVGGRNLVLGTSNLVVQANDWNMQVANIKYDKSLGSSLCASVMINNADHASYLLRGSACIVLYTYDKSGNVLATAYGNGVNYNANGLSQCSISIDDNTANVKSVILTNNMNANAFYSCLKVEQGNLPTAWTPAPEDTDNKISTVSQTVDGISSIVSDPTTGLTKRIQTAEGSISTVQSNVSDLQSKQTQTANGLTTEISNRQTGDTNTLTQAKDFTTSSISNSESGMRSQITQTSDAIMAKVDTKTDSATVLSLLKDNWSIGIADNAGALASGIAGDLNGMTLISKKITLDGDTTVTGDFYAKGGNFKNLNASNMTVGTLNGTQVNITNINANNIVSGSISGANLNINLNTGQVVFQRGRIYSSDYTTDINIDQGYISTANSDTRAILKNGQLQLTSPNYYDLQTNPYLSIYNDPRAFDSTGKFNSAVISARDRVIIGNKDGLNDMFWFGDTFYFGQSNFYGLSSGTTIGKAIPTTVGGGKTGVVLVGGSTYTNVIGGNDSPSITVGWSPDNVYSGNRVMIQGDYFHAGAVYNRTTSSSSNVFVAPDGAIVRSSSSSKYKLDIEYEQQADTANKLLTLDPATWHDKFESEQLNKFHVIGVDPERVIDMSNRRYYGIIAEDLVKAGLEHLVSRNVMTGEVEGVEYSKIGVALIPIIRDLRNRLNEQNVEIERLKEQLT